MTMPNSEPATFREEFEKAFDGLYKEIFHASASKCALVAAQLALERAAQKFDIEGKETYISEDIRQLANQLSDPHAK